MLFLIIALVIFMLTTKRQSFRVGIANVLAFPIAIFIAEVYLYNMDSSIPSTRTGSYTTDGYTRSDIDLGYAPLSGIERNLIVSKDATLIYDVIYNIGENGFRFTPSSNDSSTKCVLFFGGSFTFGEGLNDNETLPHYLGTFLANGFKVINLGFHGYGPHQMLSAIENGIIDEETASCKSVKVIYSSIPDHIARASGYSPWDRHGPKYEIHNGNIFRRGNFDDNTSFLKTTLLSKLNLSFVYKIFFDKRRNIATQKETSKYFAMIEKSKFLLSSKFSESEFTLLFWDKNNLSSEVDKMNSDLINQHLIDSNLNFYFVSDIIPNYQTNSGLYTVSPFDKHPNKYINKNIAEFISIKLKLKDIINK